MSRMLEELEAMMWEFDTLTTGLDDRSEELEEQSESDAHIRFYQAMTAVDTDYERLLNRLAETIAALLADTCLVHMVDEEDSSVKLAAAYHPNPVALSSIRHAYSSPALPVGQGVIGTVISEAQTYYRAQWNVDEMRADIAPDSFNQVSALGFHSIIVAPMCTSEGKALGTLTVARHTTRVPFERRDVALTEWAASHAAMKIETARLYHNLQETNGALDAALKNKDDFLSLLAHELRSPMTALTLISQLLLLQPRTKDGKAFQDISGEEMTSVRRRHIENILAQVERLSGLTNQLSEVARMQSGEIQLEKTRVDLLELTRDVVRRLSMELDRRGSTLNILARGRTEGYWDEDRLDHIITNLVGNAIKYGLGRPIDVVIEGRADTVMLSIRDHGAGIEPQDLARIFERFARGKQYDSTKGLGLGLWIVNNLVQAHEGNIEVESTPGEGACFRITLPRKT